MAIESTRNPPGSRAKAFIISAGALAAAILAVGGLWNFIFPRDTQDQARVEVAVIGQSTLHGFSFPTAVEGLSLRLSHTFLAAPRDARDTAAVLAASAFEAAPPPDASPDPSQPPVAPGPSQPPAAPGPSQPPVAPGPSQPPAAPGPSQPPAAPDPSQPPAAPGASQPPAAPGPSQAPSGTVEEPWTPGGVAADPALSSFALAPSHVRALMPLPVTTATPVDADDAGGQTLTNEEAAARLVDALSEVEVTTQNGALDPNGYRVSVNFTLDGFADQEILLTWSLTGTDVSTDWQADHVGLRLRPSTDHDGGNVDIWVPELKGPGHYTVEVKLFRILGGAPLASGSAGVPPQ